MGAFDKIGILVNRLRVIGIDIELAGNVPWIYLEKVNGRNVTEKFRGNHGFTIAMLSPKLGAGANFTDIKEIFKIIRKYATLDIPELGKIYQCFDDGKIKRSRQYSVEITGISKFNTITDKNYLREWKNEVKSCPSLYNKSTDYFVNGYSKELDVEITFVRCVNDGWFSFGLESGRLDIDGELLEILEWYEKNI
jgi:hypothetical protein